MLERLGKRPKNPKRVFRQVEGRSTVKPTPCQTNRFSVLETSTVGSTKDMLTHCHLLPWSRKLNQSCPNILHPSSLRPLSLCNLLLFEGEPTFPCALTP